MVWWSLACSSLVGSDPEPPPSLPAPPPSPYGQLAGSWRMIPLEERLRELKIIDAAFDGSEEKIERLGTLTPEEQEVFETWSRARGQKRADMEAELRYAKHRVFTFTDSEVTLTFAEEQFGPVPYSVEHADPRETVVLFDPGLGHAVERHRFVWESETRALDHITCERPCNVESLIAVRESDPGSTEALLR